MGGAISEGLLLHSFLCVETNPSKKILYPTVGHPLLINRGFLLRRSHQVSRFQGPRWKSDKRDSWHRLALRKDVMLRIRWAVENRAPPPFCYSFSATKKTSTADTTQASIVVEILTAVILRNLESGDKRSQSLFPFERRLFGCGSNNRCQHGSLVSGNMDQRLRNPSCLNLSHTHLASYWPPAVWGSLKFDNNKKRRA